MTDSNFKDFCEGFDEVLGLIFKIIGIIAIIVACAVIVGYNFNTHHDKDNTIEVKSKNDSLKVLVNHLDSVKDAKIIEVETLDNDSTVKLFYQLIK